MLAYVYTLEELKNLFNGKIEVINKTTIRMGDLYITEEEATYLGSIVQVKKEELENWRYLEIWSGNEKILATIPIKFIKVL